MSELRHWYDHAAVSDYRITQPPFVELADRGRRRARRTRAIGLAGVAVLAALVAAPLLTLPGQPQPDAGTVPPATEPAWEWYEVDVSFSDLDHGVAYYDGDACGEGWVSVTEDGGTTWSDLRGHPPTRHPDSSPNAGDEPVCSRSSVIPIAPDTLLIPGRPSYISNDAGLAWQEFEPQVRTAETVPDGVTPFWRCDEEPCEEAGLGWYDPQTGDWVALETNPPGVEYDGLAVALDGSIWADGTGSDGDYRLAVSHDRGRSWQDWSPDVDVDWLAYSRLTVVDGDTAYLHPMLDSAEVDPFDLYRTTDGGETWRHEPAAQQFEDVLYVWADREGGLVVVDQPAFRDGYHYRSTDGGETFVRTELPVTGVRTIHGGFQGWPSTGSPAEVDLYLSEDGLTWQPVQVPHYPGPDEFPTRPGRSPDR